MLPSVVSREVRNSLEDYLRTTFGLADERVEETLFEFLTGDEGMFSGPYVEVSRPFERAAVDAAVGGLTVTPEFTPYRHQAEAWRRLSSVDGAPRNTLVSTGTGSGKTEAFIYPILDHCWRHRNDDGVKSLILYPMNALAGDQARRIAEILWNDERLNGTVTAGLYIGDDGKHSTCGEEHLCDRRDAIREEPPDVLLTNYRMLDFLLMRPRDRKVWRHNVPETLQYLALDELHTYDGAQATDVACLIRRLAARLDAPEDHICGIGTSATMGASSREARAELRRFAEDVFGGEFEEGAIVTSTRVDSLEVEGDGSGLSAPPPWQRDDWEPEALDPDRFESLEAYVDRQASLWFGTDGADPVRLGQMLAQSESVRKLTAAASDGPTSIEQICRVFREGRDALGTREGKDALPTVQGDSAFADLPDDTQRLAVRSLLALVSFAERPDGTPLMQVRVESWTRELRRLVGRVPAEDETPEFDWEDRAGDREGLWLPGVYCRDCGEFGYAVAQADDSGNTTELATDPRGIGRAWLNQSRHAAMLRPGPDRDGRFPEYVCPACPRMTSFPECEICDTETLPAQLWTATDASDSSSKRFTGRCPSCDTDDALTILASRAATLTSVAVSQIFQSSFNEDRKLLAFTDSVQDASHRAGFLGGRTFRFTMRRAIQGALEALEPEGKEALRTDGGVPLDELGDAIWEYWEGEVGSAAELAGVLMPPDLEWIESWQSFVDSLPDEPDQKVPAPPERLVDDLRDRLSWETTMEYGLRSRVGRTLELTGCSTAAPDRDALREAADALTVELTEEEPVPGAANLDMNEVEVFLAGLIERQRTRGGIHHPMLGGFIRAGGERFMLSRKKQPLMSPFGRHSVLPRFLDEHRDPPTFDAFLSGADKATWYRDWAERSMRLDPGLRGINDVYRDAVRHLEEVGLLRASSVDRSGKSRNVWGLAPEQLRVFTDVESVTCESCSRRVVVSPRHREIWRGSRCPQYRCDGHLVPGGRRRGEPRSYYAEVYRSGRLRRIRTAEHTGLLERDEREQLEEEFKDKRRPDAPNTVVCTPTLEMGIDIGDLSCLTLCSVPPTTANYQQRIGRAGRESGDAYALTFATTRPHDLYFWQEPLEMADGDVTPPGCHLDARDVLERQLVARAMDEWCRRATDVEEVPKQMAELIDESDRERFPGRFLEWCEELDGEFVDAFLSRFGDAVREDNRDHLRAYVKAGQLIEDVELAFDEIFEERRDLERRREELQDRREKIEEADLTNKERNQKLREVDRGLKMLGGMLAEWNRTYPYNVWTDASVLPNYAFPEPGVRLRATIKRREPNEGGDEGDDEEWTTRYDTETWVRPAASALTELAPENTFYAAGLEIDVDEIDLGSKHRSLLEVRRFCPSCDHSESDAEAGEYDACPACGDPGWVDTGQVHQIVRFERAGAYVDPADATTGDNTEERRRKSYATDHLVDVEPLEQSAGAYVLDDVPFGFELLTELEIEELNFGPADNNELWRQEMRSVAGQEVPASGFTVCSECNRVGAFDLGDGAPEAHAPFCEYYRKEHVEPETEQVYLQRSFQTEAVRLLVPVYTYRREEATASLKAAVELGFRQAFRGAPDHLRVIRGSEPVSPEARHRRHFLYVYDAVPGGTGYLHKLAQPERFQTLLREALRAMRGCDCVDGCYKCVYAYQNQWELDAISKHRAMNLLGDVLDDWEDFVGEASLSEVSLDVREESELELRFLDAVQTLIEHPDRFENGSFDEIAVDGDRAYRLTVGGRSWEVLPQRDVGAEDGVAIASRPDFVIQPAEAGSDGPRPVAVFCDGFRYHVQPGHEEDRLEDDLRKRCALLESGRYLVWNVTWQDVQAVLEDPTDVRRGVPFLGLPKYEIWEKLWADAKEQPASGVKNFSSHGPVRLLLTYLKHPDPGSWRRAIRTRLLAQVPHGPRIEDSNLEAFETEVRENEALPAPPVTRNAGEPEGPCGLYWRDPYHAVLARYPELPTGDVSPALSARWERPAADEKVAFQSSWRTMLATWNVFQFLSEFELGIADQD